MSPDRFAPRTFGYVVLEYCAGLGPFSFGLRAPIQNDARTLIQVFWIFKFFIEVGLKFLASLQMACLLHGQVHAMTIKLARGAIKFSAIASSQFKD
jgi:hypothetical protein